MYLDHWRLQKFPFENVSDPDLFYLSHTHEEGLTRLLYATKMRKGAAMLSGDIGCGKTTLIKVYVKELSASHFDIGLIINPKFEPLEFLQEILYQFGIRDVPDTKVKCLRVLNEKMVENMKANIGMLLIVDEAQVLSESAFEEIRLLLNFQMNDRFLLHTILVGQPELNNKIRAIEQLDQRIAIKYHLKPFNYNDTVRYIRFRQERAGREENVFSPEAMQRIFDVTKGVPRKINNLCDLSLLIGFSRKDQMIGPQIIEEIMDDGALF